MIYVLERVAWSMVGQPYRWGGDDPLEGWDCSGLVQEILASVGADPPGDQTAQALYDYFHANGRPSGAKAGSLVFYGVDAKHITHVGFLINTVSVVEAGGGNSTTTTLQQAVRQNAYVRVRPLKNRKDLVAILRPKYAFEPN